jgi:TRAP-type C4-dicarboxylate transport system substrate-binding protein
VIRSITRRTMLGSLLAAPAIARAAEPIRPRVSVESVPTHGRTFAAADFCRRVDEASDGIIKTELFHSGQLYTDQTVVTALIHWQGLSSAHQALLAGLWDDSIAGYRTRMAAAQVAARDRLVQHGVVFTTPGAADFDAVRTRMLAVQDGLVKQWRMNPDIAAQALAEAA